MKLTKLTITDGVYHGALSGRSKAPQLHLKNSDVKLVDAEVTQTGAHSFAVRIPLPADILTEGLLTLSIVDSETDAVLDTIAIITGEPLDHNLATQVNQLRAELDLVKSAIRKMKRS